MVEVNSTVLVLAIVLFIGLIAPELFKKFRLPYVSSLILIGALLGPQGFQTIETNEVLSFFGFMGSAFLMLMAGMEVTVESIGKTSKRLMVLAGANGIIPFVIGVSVVKAFGYSWLSALIIGIVFTSSSVAIVSSVLFHSGLIKRPLGKDILASVVIEDLMSLLMLSFVLQTISPITRFPLPIYFGILVFSVVALKMFLPEFASYFIKKRLKKQHEFEGEMRFIIFLLLGVLAFFSGIGVHPIVASFLVGVILSDVIRSDEMRGKIHTIGYGIFVPVFFVIIGMEMDLSSLFAFDYGNIVMVGIILSSICAKMISGFLAGRMVGFSKKHSALFGAITTPQLTTTLAVMYVASSSGLIDSTLVTAIVVLSIVTTMFAPFAVSKILKRKVRLHA